jgi:hypothetical protein
VKRLLQNRPLSTTADILETTAVGLAAYLREPELLGHLLAKIPPSDTAYLPLLTEISGIDDDGAFLEEENQQFIPAHRLEEYPPFWHPNTRRPWEDIETVIGSPVVLGVGDTEHNLIQVLMNNGYRPDGFTLSVISLKGDLETVLKYRERPASRIRVHPPLAQAILSGNLDKLKLLIEYGEDVNAFDRDLDHGRSPLQMAVEAGHLDFIDALLKAGADVNALPAKSRGGTALQLASMTGNLGIVENLLALGADINCPGADSMGRTALEGAATMGRIDVIKHLLHRGVKTTGIYRRQFVRSVMFASRHGYPAAVEILKRHRPWTAEDEAIFQEF